MGKNRKHSNPIYNLSSYATAHYREGKDGKQELYGVSLSGYRTNEDGEREYVNLWVKPENVRIADSHDGGAILRLRMVDLTEKFKETDEDDEDEKPSRKKSQKSGAASKKQKSARKEDEDDEDDDIPF